MQLVSYLGSEGPRIAGVKDGLYVDLQEADNSLPNSMIELLSGGPEVGPSKHLMHNLGFYSYFFYLDEATRSRVDTLLRRIKQLLALRRQGNALLVRRQRLVQRQIAALQSLDARFEPLHQIFVRFLRFFPRPRSRLPCRHYLSLSCSLGIHFGDRCPHRAFMQEDLYEIAGVCRRCETHYPTTGILHNGIASRQCRAWIECG